MRFCLFVCIFFNSLLSSGQQASYFLFGEKEFEGVDIYDVIQDNDNNYWFATDQGLIKHDGYSFESIECSEMKGGSVYGFVKSSDGTIYCHNLNHQVFEIKNSKCSLIFDIPDEGMDVSMITSNDNKLLVCSSKNIYVVDGKTHKKLNFQNSSYILTPVSLQDHRILFNYSGTNKIILWKEGKGSLNYLRLSDSNFKFEDLKLKFFSYRKKTYAIDIKTNTVFLLNESSLELSFQTCVDPKRSKLSRIYVVDNSIWIANNISGVAVITNDLQNAIYPIESYTNYFISDVYKDNEGNILLSTFDNGVLIIPDTEVMDVDVQFNDYSMTKLFASENEIYFGTNEGQLLVLNEKIKVVGSKGNKKVETLYKWHENPYLFSDNNGLTITNLTTGNAKYYPLGSLKDVASISDKKLILTLNSGVYFMHYNDKIKEFDIEGPLISSRAYNIAMEKESNYIYTSTSIGLFSISPSKKIKELKYKDSVIHALALYSTPTKTYIATRKNGVLIYSKGKQVTHFFPRLNDIPLSIFKLIIHKNEIYANTQIGLVILNAKGHVLKFINQSSGLSTNKIIDFAIHKNELWITHSRGVQHLNLNKIKNKRTKPELIISSVFMNSKPISSIQKKGEYASNARRFKFIFRVNTIKSRDDIRYHYKLEGNNDKWHINKYMDNEVTYNTLGPGNYRFIVKAENNGFYSLPQVYAFSISAPFYQRWWFNLSIVFSLLLLMSVVYRRQLRIQQKKADRLNELNASRLTAIQSQMNPHFIFNSLNSIQDLVLKGDVDNSYTYITKFSNLVRRTLNYSDKDFIDFDQEIKLIELYLSLEKLRFKDDLVYMIEANQIDDILIPPMLIQPFIENALVHGLLHKEGLKQLSIKFKVAEVLICEIVDNGIGREKALEIKNRQRANQESFAVNAIKRRFSILENHFKGELGFTIEDVVVDAKVIGTKVTLRIPIKNKF